MKTFFCLLGMLLIALGITAFWARHPNLLPAPPATFVLWLGERYGAENGEQVADLELLLMFGLSLGLVWILALSLCRLMSRWKSR